MNENYPKLSENLLSASAIKFTDLASFEHWLLINCEREFDKCISYGIHSLLAFVQNNFIGPPILPDFLPPFLSTDLVASEIRSRLCPVSPSSLATYNNLELLFIANFVLVDKWSSDNSITESWWALRCVATFERILPEPDQTLKTTAMEMIENIKNSPQFDNLEKEKQIEFYLECLYIHLYYFEYSLAEQCLDLAMQKANLSLNFTGSLGRRTRFQDRDIAQLRLDVANDDNIREDDVITKELPTDCVLQDDTLLEKIAFSEVLPDPSILSSVQQAVILAACAVDRKTHIHDELENEKIGAYLDKVLQHPSVWTIQVTVLYIRCILEKNQRRKVERALSQSEELATRFSLPNPPSETRLPLVFATNAPSIVETKKLYADILVSLGCTSEALGIYEKLRLWDDTINCYRALNKLEQAETLLRNLLLQKKDPIYYCLLGDITINPEYYETAWKISDGRCARAQNSLGIYLLRGKHYNEAIECFKRSIETQPLKLESWYNLGYCALQIEDYKQAAKAYHRCTNIEPDNFEIWNNLSASYVHLGQKEKAFKVMSEALRLNFENRKVWENYLLIAVDTGHINEAILAFNRLLDLKEKYMDLEVLQRMTVCIISKGLPYNNERLLCDMRTLLGRITSKITSDSGVWRCYGALWQPDTNDNNYDNWDKYVRLLQKAHQYAVQKQDWEQDILICSSLLMNAVKLSKAQLTRGSVGDSEAQERSSVRLMLKSLLTRVNKCYSSDINDFPIEISDNYRILSDILNSLS